jgi:hypothetical protein
MIAGTRTDLSLLIEMLKRNREMFASEAAADKKEGRKERQECGDVRIYYARVFHVHSSRPVAAAEEKFRVASCTFILDSCSPPILAFLAYPSNAEHNVLPKSR